MATPKQHRSKSRQRNKRMHIYIEKPAFIFCAKCGKPVLAHTLCKNCGTYRGKELIDVMAMLTKKEKKKKEKEIQAQEEQKSLNAQELSKK
ncbi:MAG: 50S ribosomal protein L32 [bacterium]|nr:50S ribosomal protein L32 [bacterium]